MASSSADISRSQPQIIHFDHPGDLLEAARYSVEEIGPLQLDAHQRQNIRRYSKRFKRFLDIDRDRRRWESRFRDWNNRCEPHTTKMLVKMLATSNGAWPDGLPREGMQLVELYIGFQVFDCDYNLLDHSDGFKQAAKHLIFSQDPEQIARGGEVEIHALVRGKRLSVYLPNI